MSACPSFACRIAASRASVALIAILMTACAATGEPPTRSTEGDAVDAAPGSDRGSPMDDFQRDRAAILAMIGEYEVSFAFDETVVLQAGYTRKPAKRSGGLEAVVLVEDSGERIVLQHLLLVGDGVVKHWRQDWHYQASERLEFVADQTWRLAPIPTALRVGAWTQCVYEVSDAPRYCGTGRWNHRYRNPTWTSDRTWRPLPRREYTTRADYNALNVENRHSITPGGWTHEQDNSKVRRQGERTDAVLVREFGFNDYRRVEGRDFSAAYRYWHDTRAYWQAVRERWQRLIDHGGLRLDTAVDGMPIITGLFELADQARNTGTIEPARIDAIFARHVEPLSGITATAPAASSLHTAPTEPRVIGH